MSSLRERLEALNTNVARQSSSKSIRELAAIVGDAFEIAGEVEPKQAGGEDEKETETDRVDTDRQQNAGDAVGLQQQDGDSTGKTPEAPGDQDGDSS